MTAGNKNYLFENLPPSPLRSFFFGLELKVLAAESAPSADLLVDYTLIAKDWKELSPADQTWASLQFNDRHRLVMWKVAMILDYGADVVA